MESDVGTRDIHTSDLIAACLKQVELRIAGKVRGQGTGALYRGLLFHEVLRLCHVGGAFTSQSVNKAVMDAPPAVQKRMEMEGRRLTDATEAGIVEVKAEVAKLIGFYGERLFPAVKRGKLIGCELPIRCEVGGFNFASHIDILWRSEAGKLELWDWKSGQDVPTFAYLNRNLQLGMYSLAIASGEVMVGDEWIAFEENPRVSWVHLNNLAPYSRKTTGKDDDGQERTWTAGEHRPLSKIIYTPDLSNLATIEEAFMVRARMMEGGFFPATPDPIGCHLCESRDWCTGFTTNEGGEGEN